MKPLSCLRSSAFLLPLLLAGCLEMEQHTTIFENGSSRLEVKVAVSDRALRQMEAMRMMAEQFGEEAPEDAGFQPGDIFDEKKIKESMGKEEGVEVVAYKAWEGEGKQHAEMTFAYKDLDALRKSGFSGSEQSGDVFFLAGPEENTVRMVLYPQGKEGYEEMVEQMKEMEEMGEEAMAMQEQMFAMVKAQLRGLKVGFRFTVPGKIVSVGEGLKVEEDGRTATFTMTDKDITSAKDSMKLQAMRFEVVFDGEKVKFPLDKEEKARKVADEEGGEEEGADEVVVPEEAGGRRR